MVLAFTFRSMIFANGVKSGSDCILSPLYCFGAFGKSYEKLHDLLSVFLGSLFYCIASFFCLSLCQSHTVLIAVLLE